MTITNAKTAASTTLDQGTWSQINSMSITPGAGTWLIFFSMEVEYESPPGGNTLQVRIYADGTPETHSMRQIQDNSSLALMNTGMCTAALVTTDADDIVEIRYQISGGSMTGWGRELVAFPASGTNVEDTDEVTDTIASGTWTTLDTMTETPASGNYLLVFTAHCTPATGEIVAFRVSVAGSPLAHTERKAMVESSGAPTQKCVLIACEVNVNGSQIVEIEWRRDTGAGSQSCYYRSMILVGIPAASLLEVTGTVTDNDTTTTDKQVDDMLIADPGAYDFLVLFSSYQYLPDLGAPGSGPDYSIREGGVAVTNTQREFFHEDSLDFDYTPVFCGGKVTVTPATDDLQIYWQGSSSDSRDLFTRTMIAAMDVTYKIEGITKDNDGSVLVSCWCFLVKDNGDNTFTYVASQQSNGVTGAYSFTGLGDNDPNYQVISWKDDAPHVFDVTDYELTPVVE